MSLQSLVIDARIVENMLCSQSLSVMMQVRLCIWAEYVYLGRHEFCRRINFTMEDVTRDPGSAVARKIFGAFR